MRPTPAPDPPLPEADELSEPFWEGCREHRLCIQRCDACGHWRHYPRPSCPKCLSLDFSWTEVSGHGTLASWVVAHPPVLPYFADKVPLPVVLVELDEASHLRLVGGLREADAATLEIGMRREVVFEDVTED
ncbi:MAG: OB-fold domain-containing protein [Acidimicrobiia bacterium]|nr:OB-fold domain-containing protein [Acidimicrobiia bacterium]